MRPSSFYCYSGHFNLQYSSKRFFTHKPVTLILVISTYRGFFVQFLVTWRFWRLKLTEDRFVLFFKYLPPNEWFCVTFYNHQFGTLFINFFSHRFFCRFNKGSTLLGMLKGLMISNTCMVTIVANPDGMTLITEYQQCIQETAKFIFLL